MAKIAYILLCHKDPEAIIAQANQLTATGDFIAIHFDARAKACRLQSHPHRAGRQSQCRLCQEAHQMRLGGMVAGARHAECD